MATKTNTRQKNTVVESTASMEEKDIVKDSEVKNDTNSPDIAELLKEIENLKKQVLEQKTNSTIEIPSEKMIKFISLIPGSVMLRGSNTRPYEIEGQYQSRTFTETEARVIVTQMGGYMRTGNVFIDDPVFVREVGLTDAYRNMLSPEQLQTLFNKQPETIIGIYENALDGQKDIILNMIRTKIANKEHVDANILVSLSNLSGKDLLHNMSEDEE